MRCSTGGRASGASFPGARPGIRGRFWCARSWRNRPRSLVWPSGGGRSSSGFPRRPHARKRRSPRCSGGGRAWATTAAPSTCTGAPRRSLLATADTCRAPCPSSLCCPASGPTPPVRCSRSRSRKMRRSSTPTPHGCWRAGRVGGSPRVRRRTLPTPRWHRDRRGRGTRRCSISGPACARDVNPVAPSAPWRIDAGGRSPVDRRRIPPTAQRESVADRPASRAASVRVADVLSRRCVMVPFASRRWRGSPVGPANQNGLPRWSSASSRKASSPRTARSFDSPDQAVRKSTTSAFTSSGCSS